MNDSLKTGVVDVCTEQDLGQIAELHCKTFYGDGSAATAGLRAYYHDVFFTNPWVDESLSSLVYRSAEGKVVGFIGCIPRRMIFDRKPLRVAIAHRLMVDPDVGSPFAATLLVRAFLSGAQDLSISDGANDSARRIWEAAGGSTSFVHSLNWLWPLRPGRFLTNRYFGAGSLLAGASRPFCAMLDPMLRKFWGRRMQDISAVWVEEVSDEATILSCLEASAGKRMVRPQYGPECMHWLLGQLRKNEDRGRLNCVAIRDKTGVALGICLFYLKPDMRAEILLLATRKNFAGLAISGLIHYLRCRDVAVVQGSVDPCHLSFLSDNGCYLKRGSWALFHAGDVDLLNAVHRGEIFLSALEGELWLRSPNDRL